MSAELGRRYSIGYALPPKKVRSFIRPSLVDHANTRGIDLLPIDPSKPLLQQGPFDAIVHNLFDQPWNQQLSHFSSKYPDVPVIDPPDAIEMLHDRVSMLHVVNELKIPPHDETLGIPNQIVISDSESLSDLTKNHSFKFPVIAKALVSHGTKESHQMFLVFDNKGLNELKPPIVLQEFLNHGGVVFKVYVAGEFVKCVKRHSLPDISEGKLGTLGGLLPFSQISNLASKESDDDSEVLEAAEMPPLSLINDVASGLRRATRLHLFNFDMIRDTTGAGNRYLVIDINYFPGFAKMPCYETALTDFFWDILHQQKQSESTSLGLEECQDSCLD